MFMIWTPQQIKAQALENMADTTPDKLFAAKLIPTPTPEAAANHFATNLSRIPGPGKYPRLKMPQPGDSGSEDGYATTPKAAAVGAINYHDPVAADLQESKIQSSKINITVGRLKEIIKEELAARKKR